MKQKFEELYKFMKLNHSLSQWAKETSLKERTIELQKEVQEMIDELEKEDYEEFRKEVGDVFWDLLGLMVKAEEEGLLDIKEVLHEVHEKFKQRKPFLLEGKSVSLDEEKNIWKKIKEKEIEQKNKRA